MPIDFALPHMTTLHVLDVLLRLVIVLRADAKVCCMLFTCFTTKHKRWRAIAARNAWICVYVWHCVFVHAWKHCRNAHEAYCACVSTFECTKQTADCILHESSRCWHNCLLECRDICWQHVKHLSSCVSKHGIAWNTQTKVICMHFICFSHVLRDNGYHGQHLHTVERGNERRSTGRHFGKAFHAHSVIASISSKALHACGVSTATL